VSRDTLSDLLRTVRLRGAFYFYVEGADPWVVETSHARDLIPLILPGVEHMMEFHGIARGSCYAAIVGEQPIRLNEGDIVIFPHGDAHVMSSVPGMRGRLHDGGFQFTPRPAQLPYALRVCELEGTTARLEGGGPERTTVVCGFLGCDASPFNPLLASMPRVMRMPGVASGESSWIANFLRSVVDEASRKRPGGEAVLERMSEMMFVEVLRRYVDTMPPEQTGWLAGIRDPSVGRALALMHERPAESWTLERLCEESALSRSVLYERFVHFIGQPPMQYLAQWRMQLAAATLRETDAKVLEIAIRVGYESETAFSRAFKRTVGETPGAWRRSQRTQEQRNAMKTAANRLADSLPGPHSDA
jgi:AraC-like DNA-binding protein